MVVRIANLVHKSRKFTAKDIRKFNMPKKVDTNIPDIPKIPIHLIKKHYRVVGNENKPFFECLSQKCP